MPFSFASRALSVGSMPRTRQPPSLKFASSVPSLEPTSITNEEASKPGRSLHCSNRSAKLSRRMRVVPLV